jgi:hypothetical protein
MRRCCRMGRPNLKNLRADASYPHKRWCDGDSAVLLSGHEDAQRTGVVTRAGGRRRVYLACPVHHASSEASDDHLEPQHRLGAR